MQNSRCGNPGGFPVCLFWLMGGQGVHSAEKAVHICAAGKKERDHHADNRPEELIIQQIGVYYPPFCDQESNNGPTHGTKHRIYFMLSFVFPPGASGTTEYMEKRV